MRIALMHIRDERPWTPVMQRELDNLNRGARTAVASLGWDPILVPSGQIALHESVKAAARADAVILMGGEDVHAELYGGDVVYPGVGRGEYDADDAHIAVVHECLAARQPLLGLCRGNQILNVALGGTLVQHLDTVENHRGYGDGDTTFVESYVEVEGWLAEDVDPEVAVLCSHHQAIGRLGEGLRVAARAADGVIEAVVHESAPITGVQWHPEHPSVAMTQLVPLLKRLQRQLS